MLKISCSECKAKYKIPDKDLDKHCIYWVQYDKPPLFMAPRLLCRECLDKPRSKTIKKEPVRGFNND